MTGVRRVDDLQVPPHSIEAEQSVLGALLIDNEVFDAVGAVLRSGDFYLLQHGAIYRVIVALVRAQQPADVITVFEACRGRDGVPVELGYLNELAQSVPSGRAAARYAAIVRERAARREVARLARALAGEVWGAADMRRPLPDVLDGVVTALLALQHGASVQEPSDIVAQLPVFLDDLQDRADGKVCTFRTGLADLDRCTGGGGRRGELWVIGARPSMGKTAIVLQLCRSVGADYQVLLLSQEDSLLSAVSRFVAAAGGVNLADIRNPAQAPQAMWQGVNDGVEQLQALHIALDDQTGLALADVRRKVQQVRRRHRRCDLVVVDYLQLMDDGGDNRNQALGAIANGLKKLSKELQCWIVLLSQLNRKADDRPGPPQMGDLRDSGDIEGAADFIGLLYREHMRKPTDDNKHWAQLHVCKQKNGPTDTLNLFFDGALQRFSNWEGPPPARLGKGGGC